MKFELMKKPVLIVIAAIMMILSACTEPFDIRTDDSPPVIVIYGALTDELKHQVVNISRSSPYFDNEPNRGISGADVTVRSSDNRVYRFQENDSIRGLYYSENKFRVRSETDYSLTVEVDFDNDGILDSYEATTTVLSVPAIDSLTLEPVDLFGHKNYFLYAHLQDPPEKNFYLFKVLLNDSLITGKLTDLVISDDKLFNNQYMKRNIYLFDDDEISEWEMGPEEDRKRPFFLHPGDIVSIEFSFIPQGYFDFINQCNREKNGENPMFGGPASNITTNIGNGGVGFFCGYKISRKNVIFVPKDNY
jgi:hypothetical protein